MKRAEIEAYNWPPVVVAPVLGRGLKLVPVGQRQAVEAVDAPRAVAWIETPAARLGCRS